MKKMYLVLAAVVMAISLSAFTPAGNPPETVWYDIGNGWEEFENPCPAGTTELCTVEIDEHSNVQLYRNMDTNQPVKYD